MIQPLENDIPGSGGFLEVLASWTSDEPERRVLTFQTHTGRGAGSTYLTCGMLDRRARALGARLAGLELAGERAVLLYSPGLEFVTAFFGCLAAGVIAVPTPAPRPNRPPERLRAILGDARPRVVLTTAALRAEHTRWSVPVPELDALHWLATDDLQPGQEEELAGRWRDPGVAGDTLAFLQYTSGSTAVPKGVMVTHGNLLHNSALIQRSFGAGPESRGVFWLPLHHDMGLIGGVLQSIYCGGESTLFSPVEFLQEPLRWLETIARTRATISGGPNFAYDLCVRKTSAEQRGGLDLSSWTVAFNGAEPIRAETLDRFAEAFAPCGFRREAFLPCYGLAEATLMVTGRTVVVPPVVLSVSAAELEQHRVRPEPANRTLVGSGQSIAGQEIAIVDPANGLIVAPGGVGEIWVAGPSVARGYWNRAEETDAAFGAFLDGAGPFLRTGDLGFLREGELFVTGRLKDLLIIRGRNVYPQDIEATAGRSHSALRPESSAAFAVERDGEERLVVLCEAERRTRPEQAEEIIAAIRQAVGEEHELEACAVVLLKAATIPKTSSGKIRRQECRSRFLAGALDVLGSSTREDQAQTPGHDAAAPGKVDDWLAARLAAALGVDPAAIDRHQPFAQLGLGSMRSVELAGELQTWLGRPLSPTIFYEYPTVASLCGFLTSGAPAPKSGGIEASSALEPIAIVGIGCRFPGGDGPEAFWTLLREKGDAIREAPDDRRAMLLGGERTSCRGGFLDRVDLFDAGFFGLSPREAVPMDPQQRLLLEVAWEALEDAGQVAERLAGSATGVFLGISTNDYGRLASGTDAPGDVYQITGNALSIAANRLSYLLDLQGPSLAIDTACSSSLVAVHLACQSLRTGESTLALAGGVNLILSPAIADGFRQAGLLAPDGRCKTFDARADGYVRSEGAGMVVLKPLTRALADGDPIYALIRGGAVNQDGRSNGLTAPNPRSQEAVLRAAYRQAGIAPGQVGYVEAHGTGTLLGDPIEAKALGSVLAEGRPPRRPCLIGSVKTNVGHLEAAAGIAGLIKTALVLRHGEVPANLHFRAPNPQIPFGELPLEVPCERRPWPADDGPAFAGVSSFGFGGTNAHLVLERIAEPAAEPQTGSRSAHLLPISARRPEALKALARSYRAALAEGFQRVDMASIAFSAGARRSHHNHRLVVVGQRRDDWIAALDAFLQDRPHPGLFTGDVPARAEELRTDGLHAIALRYTQGAEIAWELLEPRARFVRLPSYPWQRERFWWENGAPAVASPPDPAAGLAGLREASLEERRARLLPYMQERLGPVLPLESAPIDPEQPLDALGIDSLMAIDLKLAIEKDLGVSLPLTSLLLSPTLSELAGEIADLLGDAPVERKPEAEEARGATEHPLSHGQQSLWSLHQLAPQSAAYNMVGAARVRGALDAEILRRSLEVLCDRHAALRTTFRAAEGRPVQVVHEGWLAAVEFRAEDASGLDELELRRRLAAEARRPFDLESGPLFRAQLFARSEQEQVLLLAIHHIVGDFWSIAVLMDELGRIYPALRAGAAPALAPLPLQATDCVRRQAARLASEEGDRLWSYWQNQLAGPLPVLNFPTDRPRPPIATDRGGSRSLRLESGLTQRLAALGSAHGASLYCTLLAAVQVLFHRYTGQTDVIVGSPVAGRNVSGLAGVVGYFVNTLPMRGDLSGNPRFATFLDRVRAAVHESLEHQDFPFALMVERLGLPRDPSRSPVFQVLFVFQKTQASGAQGLTSFALGAAGTRFDLGGLALESVAVEMETAQFDLTLSAAEHEGGLALALEYNADLFDAPTIERLLRSYGRLLEAIVDNPEMPVAEVPLLPAAERAWLLEQGSGAEAEDCGIDTIHRLFETQARRTPAAVAVACAEVELSYHDLNARANRLAHHLRRLGVGPEARVGLCIERSPGMIVGILGILKAGGAYVPLDPEYPADRLAFLIADARIDVLVTEESLLGLDADGQDGDPSPVASAGELAYVIYTSGSTGTPKGVMVSHRNLVHSTQARSLFYDEPLTAFLLLSSFAFDSSVAGIFSTLCSGGTLVLPPPRLQNDPVLLADLIAKRRVSHLLCVPSLYELLLVEAPADRLESLRVAIVAGEPCRRELAERHRAVLPRTALVNEYGPTEATVWCTARRCEWTEPGSGPRALVPIGRPIAGTQVYVLDAALEPVPTGVAGELHVGGPGVARGYLERPGLTAERFLPDPLGASLGGRLYRTGDLARWLADGVLEFLGRIDDQVKVRGYRIELGEIESALARHPDVREVAVLAREDEPGEVRLVAYLTTVAGMEPMAAGPDWRGWVRQRLPEYMVPAAFVRLDRLPLSPNGKIDRKALPAPDPVQAPAYLGPRDPVEERLAEIVGGLLGQERVGVHDNLLDLGVDSIKGIQIASRARQAGLLLSPRQLFEQPSIALLAAVVAVADPQPPTEPEAGFALAGLDAAQIERLLAGTPPIEDVYPLSAVQEGMLFHWLFDPSAGVYIQQFTCRLSGALDVDAFERAWGWMVGRHAALRTAFPKLDGDRPVQVVHREAPLRVAQHDWSDVPADAQTGELESFLAAERTRGFDPVSPPLMRLALFRLGEEHHQFAWSCHHILMDGWCLPLVLGEVLEGYEAFRRGIEPELPPARPYREYIAWLLDCDLAEAEVYWRRTLAGFRAPTPLAVDRPDLPGPNEPERHHERECRLDAAATASLQAQARGHHLTLNTLVQGAWALLLSRYSGHSDVVFGATVSGRPAELPGIESMIGLFINTLPVRVLVNEGATLGSWLQELQAAQVVQRQYESTALVEIQGWSDVPRGRPLFESILVFENHPLDASLPERARSLGVSGVRIMGRTNYPLTLTALPGAELTLRLGFDSRRFEAATIDRLLGHLKTVLEGLGMGLDRRLEDLSILTAAEQDELLRLGHGERSAAAVLGDEAAGRLLQEVDRLSDAELDSLLGSLLCDS